MTIFKIDNVFSSLVFSCLGNKSIFVPRVKIDRDRRIEFERKIIHETDILNHNLDEKIKWCKSVFAPGRNLLKPKYILYKIYSLLNQIGTFHSCNSVRYHLYTIKN